MTLELDGQKVVAIGENGSSIAPLLKPERPDGVIWMRVWKGDASELKQLLLKMDAQGVIKQPDGRSSDTSLWREMMRAQGRRFWSHRYRRRFSE
jgi:hypothetical protein